MEITYHWEGDYLIPGLKLSDTMEYQIGKYGRMRQRFLKSCYGVVKWGTKFPAALKMPMGILQKTNWGIDRTKEMAYY